MPGPNVERLTAFCREQLGDEVRAVGAVHDGEVDPAYMRDDLQRRYTAAQLEGLEGAFLLLIPGNGGAAAYVSLERSVSKDLSAFIKHCSDQLFSQTPDGASD
jgi:hypothetical protein